MNTNHFGECALCGNENNLTYEHIPPRKAFNSQGAKLVTGEEVFKLLASEDGREPWNADGLFYCNQQSGMGTYSLCAKCNNDTGSFYGHEYIKFAICAHEAMKKFIPTPGKVIGIKGIEIYPLRIIKQVMSMFISINRGCFDESVRTFVMDKDSTFINKKMYRVFMYFVCDGIQKLVPKMITGEFGEGGSEPMCCSEITAYPLGFVLLHNSPITARVRGVEITDFCDCKYDEKHKYEIFVPVYETHTLLPLDYRSKSEIVHCYDENVKRGEDNGDHMIR